MLLLQTARKAMDSSVLLLCQTAFLGYHWLVRAMLFSHTLLQQFINRAPRQRNFLLLYAYVGEYILGNWFPQKCSTPSVLGTPLEVGIASWQLAAFKPHITTKVTVRINNVENIYKFFKYLIERSTHAQLTHPRITSEI